MRTQNNKNILIIGALPPPHHGVTVFNENLLNSELKTQFNLIHLDTSDHRDLNNLGKLELKNISLGIRNIFQLIFLINKHNPRVIYLPISQSSAYLRDGLFIIIARLFNKKCKIIVHCHGIFNIYYDSTCYFMKTYINFTLNLIDEFIILGESLRKGVARWRKGINVIPNGIDVKGLNKTINQNINVGFMSTLLLKKGILDFVKAARIVLDKHPEVTFKCAGGWWEQEDSTKKQVEEFIIANRLENKILFTGFLKNNEKALFFAEADIFVFPSHNDAFGIVVLEAMANECAIIASNAGTLTEIIQDQISGININIGSFEEIAQTINRLIDFSDLRNRLGKAARKRYEENYTLSKNIEAFKSLFSRLINTPV